MCNIYNTLHNHHDLNTIVLDNSWVHKKILDSKTSNGKILYNHYFYSFVCTYIWRKCATT